MDLNLIGMTSKERWELYQLADELDLFYELPPQPKPIGSPPVHLYQLGAQKQLNCFTQTSNPDFSDDEKRACMYAWHVWRERTDVWEMPMHGEPEYDPAWLREGYSNFLLYDQFVSAFELERYFVNPWLRAAAWITTINQLDIPQISKFDLNNPGQLTPKKQKGNRVQNHFHYFVSEIPKWWANQRSIGRFEPVPEFNLPRSGYVSVALRDGVTSPQPDEMIEGNWHNGYGNEVVAYQKAKAFSWVELLWRRDEIEHVLPNVLGLLESLGPRGASWGSGCRERAGVSEKQFWSAERKLIHRLQKRVATASGYVNALAEVAMVKM